MDLKALKTALEAKRGFNLKMLIGCDGFLDEIIHIVDKRQDIDNYTRLNTIAELGERVSRAAGLGTNIELVSKQMKLGGNGPILSNALIEYGVRLSYVGAVGKPDIHPVFKQMAEKAAAVYSLCAPAHTDALEFDDGKLMLGKHSELREVTWEACKAAMGGAEGIAKLVSEAHLFGMENWTMLPNMSGIWEGIINEVMPLMPDKQGADKPIAFFDLADPEKRTKADILYAMELIGKFESKFRTILGLNEKEMFEIAGVFGIQTDDLHTAIKVTYNKLGIHCLVAHPTKSACCVIDGEYYSVDGPFCAKPVLTTGAGDNFNAGFCLGQALSLSPEDALALGVCTSGYYVRNAKSPGFENVIDFVGDWIDGKLK